MAPVVKEVPAAKEAASRNEISAPPPMGVAKTTGTPTAPRIINAPAAASAAPVKATPPERVPTTVVAKTEPPPPAAPAAAREPAASPPAPPAQAPAPGKEAVKEAVSGPHTIVERPVQTAARETGPGPGPTSVMSARAPSNAQAIGLVAALILAVFTVFAWTRWRERTRLAAAGGRDFAARDLEGDRPRIAGPRPALMPPGRTPEAPRAQAPGPPPFPAAGEGFPRNRAEAIAMLGANADAGVEALKKIVDGLRQSWHPDHATSEADRSLREHRIKQINIAWDLIVGRRAPAA
jgi:hypothetical protein